MEYPVAPLGKIIFVDVAHPDKKIAVNIINLFITISMCLLFYFL